MDVTGLTYRALPYSMLKRNVVIETRENRTATATVFESLI